MQSEDAAARHCPSNEDAGPPSDSDKKWHCPLCTYLNWAKSMKCVICLVPRQPVATVSTASDEQYNCASSTCSPALSHAITSRRELSQIADNHDKNDQIKINNNLNAINSSLSNLSDKEPESNQSEPCEQQVKPNSSQPSTSTTKRQEANCDLDNSSSSSSSTSHSPSSPNHSSSSNHSPNSSSGSSGSLNYDNSDSKLADSFPKSPGKWRCAACTLDNYPKSAKCVLCATPRASNATATSAINSANSSTNNSLTNIEAAVCSGGKSIAIGIEDKNRSTPSPIQSATTLNRSRLNPGSLVTGNAIINYTNLNNRRKNREYVFDWNWLEACVGVLSGDPEPVLVYLNNGGDLARQLTLVEVNFLNKQTLVGYTLIHLAIRFKVNFKLLSLKLVKV